MRGLTVAAMLLVNDPGDWDHVHPWLEHAEWNGCTPADYIFPFFLFIVGVSITLSMDGQLARAGTPAAVARKMCQRGLRIGLLGLALAAVAAVLIPSGHGYRVMGVLQRIGLCYAAGGLIALYCRDARVQWALFVLILVGYWALLVGYGPLSPGANLADHIDNWVLGARAYLYDTATGEGRDPEGLLSTLPALATVLLGIRAGAWLRTGRTQTLLWVGAVAMILGAAWATVFPLNKQLWTSSFALWTGGAALLALVLTHQLIDVWGWRPLARSLGINAISAYAGSWLAVCLLQGSGWKDPLFQLFVTALGPPLPAWVPSLAFAVAFTMPFWLVVSWLTRRGWRLTI